jgi:GNAT superfamily N-acetyltransferase
MSAFDFVTIKDRPDLLEATYEISGTVWPEFMNHDPVSNRYWHRLYQDYPEFQFLALERGTGRAAALGNCLPLAWDQDPGELPDTGWDWALAQGFEDERAKVSPVNLCAIAIAIDEDYRGQALSSQMVEKMKSIGEAHGLKALFAPVRPSLKSRYPLIPMERYIEWKEEAGLPFDPWLRVHARLGARILRVCPQSMRIPGTVKEWEQWTGIRFPDSGSYVVPGALVPVSIDVQADLGVYVEPNAWMLHPLKG